MTSSFKPLAWSDDEPIYTSKLNAMAANDDYLYERTPKIRYQAYGVKRDTTLKVASGVVSMPRGKPTTAKNVYFGNFFSSGCRPVVLVSLLTGGEHRIIVSAKGVSSRYPTQEGFRVVAADMRKKIKKPFAVSWIAVGY